MTNYHSYHKSTTTRLLSVSPEVGWPDAVCLGLVELGAGSALEALGKELLPHLVQRPEAARLPGLCPALSANPATKRLLTALLLPPALSGVLGPQRPMMPSPVRGQLASSLRHAASHSPGASLGDVILQPTVHPFYKRELKKGDSLTCPRPCFCQVGRPGFAPLWVGLQSRGGAASPGLLGAVSIQQESVPGERVLTGA